MATPEPQSSLASYSSASTSAASNAVPAKPANCATLPCGAKKVQSTATDQPCDIADVLLTIEPCAGPPSESFGYQFITGNWKKKPDKEPAKPRKISLAGHGAPKGSTIKVVAGRDGTAGRRRVWVDTTSAPEGIWHGGVHPVVRGQLNGVNLQQPWVGNTHAPFFIARRKVRLNDFESASPELISLGTGLFAFFSGPISYAFSVESCGARFDGSPSVKSATFTVEVYPEEQIALTVALPAFFSKSQKTTFAEVKADADRNSYTLGSSRSSTDSNKFGRQQTGSASSSAHTILGQKSKAGQTIKQSTTAMTAAGGIRKDESTFESIGEKNEWKDTRSTITGAKKSSYTVKSSEPDAGHDYSIKRQIPPGSPTFAVSVKSQAGEAKLDLNEALTLLLEIRNATEKFKEWLFDHLPQGGVTGDLSLSIGAGSIMLTCGYSEVGEVEVERDWAIQADFTLAEIKASIAAVLNAPGLAKIDATLSITGAVAVQFCRDFKSKSDRYDGDVNQTSIGATSSLDWVVKGTYSEGSAVAFLCGRRQKPKSREVGVRSGIVGSVKWNIDTAMLDVHCVHKKVVAYYTISEGDDTTTTEKTYAIVDSDFALLDFTYDFQKGVYAIGALDNYFSRTNAAIDRR